MFALSVDSISREQARFRFRLLLIASLAAAIVANILWLELPNRPSGSLGASGVVYAMFGITTMFLLIDIIKQSSEYKLRNITLGKFIYDSMRSLVFAGPVVGIAIFNIDMFLSAAPQSNVFVHGVAFLIGVAVIMVFEHMPLMWNILKYRTAYS